MRCIAPSNLFKALVVTIASVVVTGCSSLANNTVIDKSEDFFLISSYGWADDAQGSGDEQLREVIDTTMQSRGYDLTDADLADVSLHSGFIDKPKSISRELQCDPDIEQTATSGTQMWIVAMISPMSNCEVFRGHVITSDSKAQMQPKKAAKKVEALLSKFPPEHTTLDYLKALMQYLFGSADE